MEKDKKGRVAYFDPDITRLLKPFTHQEADRVPFLEYWITNQEVFEYVLGRKLDYKVASAYGEESHTIAQVPQDVVEFAQRIGMDAVGPVFQYRPANVFEKSSDGAEHYIDGRIKSWDDLKYLTTPQDIEQQIGQLERFLEAAEGTGVGVYPNISSFFDGTFLSMGYQDFMYMVYDDLKLVEHIMDRILEAQLAVMERVVQYNEIAFVFVNDDIAFKSGLMIQPELFRELFIPRMRKLIQPVLDKGKIVTFHTDGDMRPVIPILLELGISAVHPNEPAANDIYELKRLFGDKICLCGNIETKLLAYGTREEIEKDVREHIERLAPGGGYVLGSCTSIIEGIPPENFLAMVEAVHRSGRYSVKQGDSS